MLASSSGASTSSRMQKGEGLYWKIANSSAIAVSAFSPPESSSTFCSRLPGGWAMMSMPLSRTSSSSSRRQPAGAAAEELLEHLPEVLVDDLERLAEALAGGAVDLPDRLVELRDRVEQVLPLGGQERVALLELLGLLHGEHVDLAHALELVAQLLDESGQGLEVAGPVLVGQARRRLGRGHAQGLLALAGEVVEVGARPGPVHVHLGERVAQDEALASPLLERPARGSRSRRAPRARALPRRRSRPARGRAR